MTSAVERRTRSDENKTMEIRQLRSFLSVAKELHFRRAAERLHISQPPLSRQIMDLEDELGVKLFTRTTRGVSLTPAGEYLKDEAQKVLDHSEQIMRRIAHIEDEAGYRVRVGFVGSAMLSFLPRLIRRLEEGRPAMSLELLELGSAEQVKALEARRIDLGFIRAWVASRSIDFAPLADETLSVVYADSLVAGGEGDWALEELAPLPYIALSDECAPVLQGLADRICARAGFAPRKSLVVDHYGSALRLAGAGLGWSILPTQALEDSRLDLRSRALDGVPERIVVGLASRKGESDPLILELIGDIERAFAQS